ncbi:hypothetical protein ACLOJK_028508 [Asimina triloba]
MRSSSLPSLMLPKTGRMMSPLAVDVALLPVDAACCCRWSFPGKMTTTGEDKCRCRLLLCIIFRSRQIRHLPIFYDSLDGSDRLSAASRWRFMPFFGDVAIVAGEDAGAGDRLRSKWIWAPCLVIGVVHVAGGGFSGSHVGTMTRWLGRWRCGRRRCGSPDLEEVDLTVILPGSDSPTTTSPEMYRTTAMAAAHDEGDGAP